MCRFFAKVAANVGAAKAAAKSAATKVGQKVRICCLRCMRLFRNASHHHHGKHPGMSHGGHHDSQMQPNVGSLKLQGHEMPHEHHSWVSGFLNGVQRAISVFVLPMMAGIAFGMVAGAVGMMVAQLFVMLWGKFRPARKVAYERVEDLDEKEELPAYHEDLEAKNENEKV